MTGQVHDRRNGTLLVLGSATVWSFAGVIARFLSVTDSWVVVFWRSLFATIFLLCFMLRREGPRRTTDLFVSMGWAGVGVGMCFAICSTAFVAALAYTTVANVMLIQAGVPLIAALMTFLLFRERVGTSTWAAIAAVIAGVGIMVSASLGGQVSPMGDGLALLIAVAMATAIVITRRHSEVAMMPAVCLGTLMAGTLAAVMAPSYEVNARDGVLLFMFGSLNLGLGMAFFVSGVRLIPAALAALIGVAEPMLGPLWVWLIHNEVPGVRTLIGGAVVFIALVAHLGWQFKQRGRSPQPVAG
ncbi:EamA family transporter [Aromatoleum toluvorans]|uniref:EamA family transporter n=1 Tax=Aromatoleum toluvorans TaxID=92002 RepID=A0ABX1Q6N4_9RHOO|nr:DMT family transporter [Aromatoleum toluvorans]NMG46145.1 EamA family transporter [Aromatoleum toluvorans]